MLVLYPCFRPSTYVYLLDVALATSGLVCYPRSSPTLSRGMNSLPTKLPRPSLAFPHLLHEAACETGPRCHPFLKADCDFPRLTGRFCCVPIASCSLVSPHLLLVWCELFGDRPGRPGFRHQGLSRPSAPTARRQAG